LEAAAQHDVAAAGRPSSLRSGRRPQLNVENVGQTKSEARLAYSLGFEEPMRRRMASGNASFSWTGHRWSIAIWKSGDRIALVISCLLVLLTVTSCASAPQTQQVPDPGASKPRGRLAIDNLLSTRCVEVLRAEFPLRPAGEAFPFDASLFGTPSISLEQKASIELYERSLDQAKSLSGRPRSLAMCRLDIASAYFASTQEGGPFVKAAYYFPQPLAVRSGAKSCDSTRIEKYVRKRFLDERFYSQPPEKALGALIVVHSEKRPSEAGVRSWWIDEITFSAHFDEAAAAKKHLTLALRGERLKKTGSLPPESIPADEARAALVPIANKMIDAIEEDINQCQP
jgi:hypothetical protein